MVVGKRSQGKLSRAQALLLALFCLTMLDSVLTYFMGTLLGRVFPVNAVLPPLIAIAGLLFGFRRVLPPGKAWVWILIGVCGFVIGILTVEEFPFSYWMQISTAIAAFCIGYAVVNLDVSARAFAYSTGAIGAIYVGVCLMALLGIYPRLFPIIEKIHFELGQVITRPEVTADPNYQVFYLFPVILPLVLEFRYRAFVFSLFGALCALYLESRLQSRSGSLIIAGATAVAWWAAFRNSKGIGRVALFVSTAIAALVVLIKIKAILALGTDIVHRFTVSEMGTLYGRIYSATYLFEKLIDPLFWLPQGYEDFKAITGKHNVPHFNPTGFFLQGGILGLAAWIGIFLLPYLRLAKGFVVNRLDGLAGVVFVASTTVMIASFSLNVVFTEAVWLWGGAVWGALSRQRRSARAPQAAVHGGTYPDRLGSQRAT